MKKIKLTGFKEWEKEQMKDPEFVKALNEPDDDPLIEMAWQLMKSKENAMKKLKKIPKFKNEKEERDFWDKHSIADYGHELKPVNKITFPKPRKKRLKHKVTA